MQKNSFFTAKPLLRAGVIGLGHQSLSDHIPALLRRPDVRLAAVADVNEQSQRNFMFTFPEQARKVQIVKDFEDILQHIDFAVVAIPHNQYLPVCRALCKRGIPFMKEKPLARTLHEAEAIVQIKDSQKYCFICTQRRYHPLFQQAKSVIASLGEVTSFRVTYTHNRAEPASSWRRFRSDCGGGVILDMGYHPIDYCVEWFGYPDKVQSSISRLDAPLDAYDTEDEAEITFSYKRGLKGLITLSRCARKKQEEYQVRGSLGTLTGNKAELTITDAKGRQISSIADPYAKQAAFDAQLDTFISTFTQGKDFGDNLIAHLQNMKLITHCYETSERPAVSLIPDGSIS